MFPYPEGKVLLFVDEGLIQMCVGWDGLRMIVPYITTFHSFHFLLSFLFYLIALKGLNFMPKPHQTHKCPSNFPTQYQSLKNDDFSLIVLFVQSNSMSLYPSYVPLPSIYPLPPHNPNALFACLSDAHEVGADHCQLMKHLRECMLSSEGQVEIYTATICRYLRTNLQLNIQIVETVGCLSLIHPHISPLVKRLISASLREKYPSELCYYQQTTTLASINAALVVPFFQLVRGLSRWFRRQVQEKDYCDLEAYQLEYIIAALYAEERYIFEHSLEVEGGDNCEAVLSLYRITAALTSKMKRETWKKLMDSLFYYLCNTPLTAHPASKYLYFSIGEMMRAQSTLMEAQHGMVGLIMAKVRRAAQRNRGEEVEDVLRLMQNAIVNLLASAWTVEMESFWLWRFKLVLDLLSIEDKLQLALIRQVREAGREICKFLGNN